VKGLFQLLKFIIKFIIAIIKLIIFVIFIGTVIVIYAGEVEPRLLTVKEYDIVSNHVTPSMRGMTIVQISDTHLGENYHLRQLENLVEKVNSIKPDIIVFTGDLVDDHSKYNQTQEAIVLLQKLKATKGKFAIYGNHDHGGSGSQRYKEMMTESGFVLLKNSSYTIKQAEGEFITLFGIDDVLLGSPNIEKTLESIQGNHFNILLSHEPDIADEVKYYNIDLQLAGHSHGGQITIPLIGSPITPKYAKKYVKGMYDFSDNERMKLYVNRGIGTSQLKYRFLNIPEITTFTLK
jgi:predicted MPP superfamily phosphohydrolase